MQSSWAVVHVLTTSISQHCLQSSAAVLVHDQNQSALSAVFMGSCSGRSTASVITVSILHGQSFLTTSIRQHCLHSSWAVLHVLTISIRQHCLHPSWAVLLDDQQHQSALSPVFMGSPSSRSASVNTVCSLHGLSFFTISISQNCLQSSWAVLLHDQHQSTLSAVFMSSPSWRPASVSTVFILHGQLFLTTRISQHCLHSSWAVVHVLTTRISQHSLQSSWAVIFHHQHQSALSPVGAS